MVDPLRRFLRNARFVLRTRDEASTFAGTLAALTMSEPITGELALAELLINAVEHGSYGIGRTLKAHLLRAGLLEDELRCRATSAPYRDRVVEVDVWWERDRHAITISDQGDGFDWRDAMARLDDLSCEPNGRGLLLVRSLACADIDFNARGNAVTVRPRT
ncbi:MAG TPA: ATP-binding protein [Kofleriaceae bacterium]|nr:ATP-binding protein [Kofleriaceae bacterium]